ncbi:iron ABC transporter permease [bacterium]|nr:iron ABC transporter permease [bacterium]
MKRLLLPALLLLVLLAAAVSLSVGPGGLGPAQLLDGLSGLESTILWKLRLPRVLMAILAGSALSASGVLMQLFFRNPLAEPYITGVSAGAALGAVVATSIGLTSSLLIGFPALLGAMLITLALHATFTSGRRDSASILLMGIALGTLCGALVWLLLVSGSSGGTEQVIGWLLGRVSTVGMSEVLVMLPVVLLGCGLALHWRRELDAMLLGDDKAHSLGVDIRSLRLRLLAVSSLLAGISVAFCGVIAFVGLMVPHVARMYGSARHAVLLPLAMCGGALLLLSVDIVSRTAAPPREIPLTIITSLIGAPFFLWVLLRQREVRL